MVPDSDTITRFGAEVRSFLEATKPAGEPETKTDDQPKGNTP
jgi:hypothetical protein